MALVWYHPNRTQQGATINEEPWCSGLTCLPVTQKIAGSNPVGSGRLFMYFSSNYRTDVLPLRSLLIAPVLLFLRGDLHESSNTFERELAHLLEDLREKMYVNLLTKLRK